MKQKMLAVPRGFRVIHHRALNDPVSLAESRQAARTLSHVENYFEGDVCWTLRDGKHVFYMRHPKRVFDYLTPDAVKTDRLAGRILMLEDILRDAPEEEKYTFELKVGPGDPIKAAIALAERLKALGLSPSRFVIDGYSRRMMAALRPLEPRLTLTLHLENLWFEQAIVTAPRTDLSIRRLESLNWLDAINIRWWGSMARGAQLAEAFKKRNLAFGMSRLNTAQRWAFAIEAGACAGYAKSSDLLKFVP